MDEYYSEKLSANKLKQCYDLASPRVKQYLEAEINFVLSHIEITDVVLELGSGYGRIMKYLSKKANQVYGIDTSEESLLLAKTYLADCNNCKLFQMNAKALAFEEGKFNVVIGIQNGISAFKVEPSKLIQESIRVTREGGKVIFSSYSERFWNERLAWFIDQSEAGLLGEIDYDQTKNGIIVCKDGFTATTFTLEDFQKVIKKLNLTATIEEVDDSSIFCIIEV
ncbi:MAG: class I SAM-dependent methyltransferase [Candidatus Heimdallarchaeota archaeon]